MKAKKPSIPISRINLLAFCLWCIIPAASAQHSKPPPGIIQFRDSTVRDIFLDLKNVEKGILRYRRPGAGGFDRAPLEKVIKVEVYPGINGKLNQVLAVRSRHVNGEEQLFLVEEHQTGTFNLLSNLTQDSFYLEDRSGAFTAIPSEPLARTKLFDDLLRRRQPARYNRTAYGYKLASLRRLTAYLNERDRQKFPGWYIKGKLEYLRKNWHFTKEGNSLNLPVVLPTSERANAKIIDGNPSNIFALSALFETPFYRNHNLTFIQEIGLRKELTSIYTQDIIGIKDFKLDAGYLTGELAVKYSDVSGNQFPFVRLGLGAGVLLTENNRMTRSIKSATGLISTTTYDKFAGAVTLHPGLRAGTEFYIKGPYLLTAGVTYTRELVLFRTVSSSSNAFGVYVAVNFY